MEDEVEALEALHGTGDEDLHFWFIGTAKNRQFIVNVQFGSADDKTAERCAPRNTTS